VGYSERLVKSNREVHRSSRRANWFWRGVLVSAVANSFLAAADLTSHDQPVWVDSADTLELPSESLNVLPRRLTEVELKVDDIAQSLELTTVVEKPAVFEDVRILKDVSFGTKETIALPQVVAVPMAKDQNSIVELPKSFKDSSQLSAIRFPSDVPRSEILRVSRAFHGMVQETMRESGEVLSQRFVGSLAQTDGVTGEKLADLETTLFDEVTESEDAYSIGQDVDTEIETSGLDPFKTYTVVNGRVHAIVPKQSARGLTATAPQSESMPAAAAVVRSEQVVVAQSGSAPKVMNRDALPESLDQSNALNKAFELPPEQVNQELNKLTPPAKVAALDSSPSDSNRVTVRGRVVVPAGFAQDRTVLRMAGTAFQVQTDAAGLFELRDVPQYTRFELLVWNLDGGLTRRLVPVVASGREKSIEVTLQKTSDVDNLATSFSLIQQMNKGGFCARVENETPAALAGGQVFVTAGRKNLQAHFFSQNGLPNQTLTELSEDGRFCVFNVEDSVVDLKILLVNGTRRGFAVHVEPSTFEHDLIFDVSESMYRKVSLLEPLDNQQILQLSAQGVQPEFGDKRLKDWIFGNDVPVWTSVTRFIMQTDPAYALVRPTLEDVQYFPGGQELVEVRLAPDMPGAPWSRVLLSRDQLMTDQMMKQIENQKLRVYQDRAKSLMLPAVDAEVWSDIVAQYPDVSDISDRNFGGLYISISSLALGYSQEDLVVSVRDTWSGQDACKVVSLNNAKDIKSSRYLRTVCAAAPGQYALIVESREGALLWSDIARVRAGDVQTLTVLDPKF